MTVEQTSTEKLECVQSFNEQGCRGGVQYRTPLSATGRSYPRCDRHWDARLQLEAELNQRYPATPPPDWSPLDAGEAWDEEDY